MKTLLLVGIGTGHPDHITRAGEAALRSADYVLIPEKGEQKEDLAELRHDLLQAVAPGVRTASFPLPTRATKGDYLQNVHLWHDQIAQAWQAACPPDATRVALMVWGDPSLYDSTLRIAERLDPKPEIHVTPGITALQALTAAHAIPLNDLAAPVTITTGRRLACGWPQGASRVAVMLDGKCSFQTLEDKEIYIWWGAYLGMANQVLRKGRLADIEDEIIALRSESRKAHGWIMDTYLLAKPGA